MMTGGGEEGEERNVLQRQQSWRRTAGEELALKSETKNARTESHVCATFCDCESQRARGAGLGA